MKLLAGVQDVFFSSVVSSPVPLNFVTVQCFFRTCVILFPCVRKNYSVPVEKRTAFVCPVRVYHPVA